LLPHTEYDDFARRLRDCRTMAVPWSGTVYRSVTPIYATREDLLSGHGSRVYGGRWNPPAMAAVYASLTPETALAEVLNHFRRYGFPVHAAMPRTFVAIDVALGQVLDLTVGLLRRRLRVSRAAMLSEDWRAAHQRDEESLTQAVGRAAHEVGVAGLLVASAAQRGGTNLVWFPENLSATSHARLRRADQLP